MPSHFERDLEFARQIQASFLPDEVAAHLQPARQVADRGRSLPTLPGPLL
jgi:hypothetical protein